MAGQVASTGSDDALMQDQYGSAVRKGKASGKKAKKAPPKKKKGKTAGAKKSAKKGVNPFAKAAPTAPSPIQQAMGVGAPC